MTAQTKALDEALVGSFIFLSRYRTNFDVPFVCPFAIK